MKGADQLFAMRRAGGRPACVWLMDDDTALTAEMSRDWFRCRNPFDGRYHAHIRLEAADIPEALDLRCLVGIPVHVYSDRGAERARRIVEAAKQAGSALVVALINGELAFLQRQQETAHG